ncbi:hypothetical protein GCM10011317_04770 [Niveispirillum cyanobacteriorum]|nr:hypothetical protein GCM10011317_04770 [Niveispirillum cyanobacteriorum]
MRMPPSPPPESRQHGGNQIAGHDQTIGTDPVCLGQGWFSHAGGDIQYPRARRGTGKVEKRLVNPISGIGHAIGPMIPSIGALRPALTFNYRDSPVHAGLPQTYSLLV